MWNSRAAQQPAEVTDACCIWREYVNNIVYGQGKDIRLLAESGSGGALQFRISNVQRHLSYCFCPNISFEITYILLQTNIKNN